MFFANVAHTLGTAEGVGKPVQSSRQHPVLMPKFRVQWEVLKSTVGQRTSPHLCLLPVRQPHRKRSGNLLRVNSRTATNYCNKRVDLLHSFLAELFGQPHEFHIAPQLAMYEGAAQLQDVPPHGHNVLVLDVDAMLPGVSYTPEHLA